MKPMTRTKARPLSQPTILPLPAQKLVNPRRTWQAQFQTPVPALFAEGVDVGVELALRWMEAELVHSEASPSVEKALSSIRHQSRQARQSSFLQQSLDASATRPARSRRTLSSTRARSARGGTREAVI